MARTQPEQLLHAAVPPFWQLRHREALLEQFQLQLKAQHDVQAVAQFIGLHPRQAGLHRIETAPEAPTIAPGIATQG